MSRKFKYSIAVFVSVLLACWAASAYVVDNEWHAEDEETHNWEWARDQVNKSIGGGIITFAVDIPTNQTCYIWGGVFTKPVTIYGRNGTKAVQCNDELTLTNNSSVYYLSMGDTLRMGNGAAVQEVDIQAGMALGANAVVLSSSLHGSIQAGDSAYFRGNTFIGFPSLDLGDEAEITGNKAEALTPVQLAGSSIFEGNTNMFSVQISGADNQVRNCMFSGHDAGVVCEGADNLIENCQAQNHATLVIGGERQELKNCDVNTSSIGLLVTGRTVNVENATFRACTNAGMYIYGSDVTVKGSLFVGNQVGIYISGSNVVVGGPSSSERNLIYSNKSHGVHIEEARGVDIYGNLIGCVEEFPATNNAGNSGRGIFIEDSHDVRIGLAEANYGNWIAANKQAGIYCQLNSVETNYHVAFQFNRVLWNSGQGIYVEGGEGVRVMGNYIGCDELSTRERGNSVGLYIKDARSVQVGSEVEGGRNIISGNRSHGVVIEASAPGMVSNTTLLGNYIGTVRDGSAALTNGGSGVYLLDADLVRVGGTNSHDGNLISGNASYGVECRNLHVTPEYVTIYQNLIGVDAEGTGAVANGKSGILLSGDGHQVGGPLEGMRNVISGNKQHGIHANEGGGYQNLNLIQGNFIGTDGSGSNALPNAGYGILCNSGGLVIGGINAAGYRAGNVISGNGLAGICATSYPNVQVDGNIIGLDVNGEMALSNGGHGIHLLVAQDVRIGTNEGNVISGNTGHGIYLDHQANLTIIEGNIIGMNAAMTAVRPNGGDGICVVTSAYTTVIGRRLSDGGNIIAGNTGRGLTLNGSRVTLAGNHIGTVPGSDVSFPNGGDGIAVWRDGGSLDYIGTGGDGGNIIDGVVGLHMQNCFNVYLAGNSIGFNPSTAFASAILETGIRFTGGSPIHLGYQPTNSYFQGNAVGAASGTAILGEDATYVEVAGCVVGCATNSNGYVTNAADGIILRHLVNSKVGEVTSGEMFPNYVAGCRNGIVMEGFSNGYVRTGVIGWTPQGTPLGNSGTGWRISNIVNTIVGAYSATEAIEVGGSAGWGMYVDNARNCQFFNLHLGINLAGDSLFTNGGGGLCLMNSSGNVLGHSWSNVFAGNAGDGLRLGGNSLSNSVRATYIGTVGAAAPILGNTGNGISLDGAAGTLIEEIIICGSGQNGVRIAGEQAFGNTISQNSIYGSGVQGIAFSASRRSASESGPNRWQDAPVLGSAVAGVGLYGSLDSRPNRRYNLEYFFNDGTNASGNAEGQTWISQLLQESVETDSSGHANIVFSHAGIIAGRYYTATVTDEETGDTSEFSNWVKVGGVQPTPTPSPTPTASPTPTPTPTPTPNPCAVSLNPSAFSFPTNASSGSIAISIGTGCVWNASITAGSDWLALLSETNGMGSSNLLFSIGVNTNDRPRNGAIQVNEQSVAIRQRGLKNSVLGLLMLLLE